MLYDIVNNQTFNDTLTNDIVSFEQVGPDPDHPAHTQKIIRAFTLHSYIL